MSPARSPATNAPTDGRPVAVDGGEIRATMGPSGSGESTVAVNWSWSN